VGQGGRKGHSFLVITSENRDRGKYQQKNKNESIPGESITVQKKREVMRKIRRKKKRVWGAMMTSANVCA
jgi:hypothetical protein